VIVFWALCVVCSSITQTWRKRIRRRLQVKGWGDTWRAANGWRGIIHVYWCESSSLCIAPRYEHEYCFVCGFPSFVRSSFWIRMVLRWRWIRSIGGMIQGKREVLGEKLSKWHCAHRSETGTRFSKSTTELVSLCLSALLLRGKIQNYTRSGLKSLKKCPLVLLVKVAWRQVRASKIWRRYLAASGVLGVCGRERKLSIRGELWIWWMADSWRNFDRFGRIAFWRKCLF
jgi:hypothetical protein